MPGYDNSLNFRGALADFQQLLIAIESLDIVFTHQSVSSVKLHGMIGAAVHDLRTIKLGHGGFLGIRLIVVAQPAGSIEHQAGRIDFKGHVGQLEGIDLETGDRATELFALLAVIQCPFETPLGSAKPHGPDG